MKNPFKYLIACILLSGTFWVFSKGEAESTLVFTKPETGLQDTARKSQQMKQDSLDRKQRSRTQPGRTRRDTASPAPTRRDTSSIRNDRRDSDSDPVMRGRTTPAYPDSVK